MLLKDYQRIGELSGDAAFTVYGISPLLFPQRGVRNYQYLPIVRDLPQSDLLPAFKAFSWGYTPNEPGFASLETKNQIIQILVPTVIWGANGVSNDNTGGGGSNQGFQFQIYKTHGGIQTRWFLRPLLNTEILGTGQRPRLLRKSDLLLPGDSIECEVKNMGTPASPNLTSIQVVLFCGEIAAGGQQ